MPTIEPLVIVMICRTPSMVIDDRRRIAGPGPFHAQRSLPRRRIEREHAAAVHVAADLHDQRAAVEHRRHRGAAKQLRRVDRRRIVLRHASVPSAMFHADRTPVTPSVNSRVPATSGVEFGPFAICVAYWFFVNGGGYFCCHTTLPVARSIAVTISSGSRRLCTNARPFADDRRRIAFADLDLPAALDRCRPWLRESPPRESPVTRRPAPLRPVLRGMTEAAAESHDSEELTHCTDASVHDPRRHGTTEPGLTNSLQP